MPEYSREQINEYRENSEKAFEVLDGLAQRHIEQFGLSTKSENMRVWPFLDYIANTIHNQYPFKRDVALIGEKGFLIYQLLGSLEPNTYNCRLSCALAGRIIDKLGYGDAPCLVVPRANQQSIWHLTAICFKDEHQYMMDFFVEGHVPTIDTDNFDFRKAFSIETVDPQGLFELDRPFLEGNQRFLLAHKL